MKKMKNIKFLILVFCTILVLTGCDIKSNIDINYDGKVNEEVSILEKSKIFGSDYIGRKQIISSVINKYEKVLDFKKYNYDYIISNDLSGAKIYKNYDNICSYFKGSAFNQYVYKYIECKEDDYYYEIKNSTDYIEYCGDCSDWPALDNITLKIKLPVSAAEQNADEINGTTYIWKYNKETQNKNFYLKVSKSALKESEREYFKNLERKKTRQKILIIGTIIGIVVLISVVAVIYYRKYKKNSFDYE